ncbi:NucA/NucB deoxyribonuclease domain-containing protein [Streptomyces sp. NPDC023838]|uniref:NucA/NucB deoxyribonuclease domain-containing protein n=1 Tax=Streptomyces sp. NPDC023838 TaxID=3154325 RepID=UPI00340D838C
MTRTDECRTQLGRKEGEKIVNRFFYCNTKHWAHAFIYPPDTTVVGNVEWWQTTAADAPSDDRKIYLETALEDWKFDGVFHKKDALDVSVKAPGGAPPNPNPDCTVTSDSRNGEHTIAEWEANQRTLREYHTVGQDSSQGLGKDKVSLCAFATYDRINGGAGSPRGGFTTGAIAYNEVRFDTSSYIDSKSVGRGVFNYALPVLQFSKSQPAHASVANHIWTAQYDPAMTVPKKEGKSIPGAPRSGKPLSRLYPGYDGPGGQAENEYKLNRKITADECAKLSRPTDYQCDEYPMAATWQGSGFGDGNYSLRMVPAGENSSAGGSLSAFYANQRILHNDQFYVFVS